MISTTNKESEYLGRWGKLVIIAFGPPVLSRPVAEHILDHRDDFSPRVVRIAEKYAEAVKARIRFMAENPQLPKETKLIMADNDVIHYLLPPSPRDSTRDVGEMIKQLTSLYIKKQKDP